MCYFPLYKAGDSKNISNYRPIALSLTLSKIFEKCIKYRILQFLNKNNFFSKNQFIHDKLDNDSKVLGLFLDVKKAFDSVNHAILLKKLYFCGLRGKMYVLLKSYISKRTQIVKLKNSVSTSLDVTHGVPQGTVLGPLLFIIYINGLLNINVDVEIICYADDTAILIHSSSTESLNIKANNVIKDIKDWFDNNLLELNLNKSKYIHFNINSVVNSPELNICIHSFNVNLVFVIIVLF